MKIFFIHVMLSCFIAFSESRSIYTKQARSSLSESHQHTLNVQNKIIETGQNASEKLALTLVRPVLFVNNGISSVASALPSIFAAGGAALGSSISTPIQIGTIAMNNIASGLAGTLVAIPISAVAGGTAQLVGAVESGRQLYAVKTAELKEFIREHAPQMARPLSAVSGANTVLAGMTLHTVGTGVNHLGTGAKVVGQQISNVGENAKSLSDSIFGYLN